MTKLEEKLIELGYKKQPRLERNYKKLVKDKYEYFIWLINENKKIYKGWVNALEYGFETQEDIDNLQQAYNQLQKDLEVLKEYAKV